MSTRQGAFMTALPQYPVLTIEEYFELEARSDIRHEYDNGLVYAMSGASEFHVLITTNIVATFRNQTKGGPCRVYGSDMRVGVRQETAYFYPDVTVACGERQFDRRAQSGETLINPMVLIEVLSDSTEPYDKNHKRRVYERIPSLMDYLLIRQDRIHITHDTRQDDDWHTHIYKDRKDEIALPSIGCVLRLEDVYDTITWDTPDQPQAQ
jgi:Uma2 family endonuclease